MAENWSIKYLISDLLAGGATTKPDPREEIWASDLGKPLYDTICKLNGVPYTNPTDGGGMVTFLLGKAIEKGIYEMLTQCGIAYEGQDKINVQLSNCLPVVGRPDLVIEVKDWADVENNIQLLSRRDYRTEGMLAVVAQLKSKYPNGLKKTPFEIKSINSMALRYNKTKGMANAYPYHHLQLYTYMKAMGIDEGHLLYLAKDTGYMEEVIVKKTKELDKKWCDEVSKISQWYKSKQIPPMEPLMVNGKKNWLVEYSPYKDFIYQSYQEDVKTIII